MQQPFLLPDRQMKRLPDAELEIMLVIWAADKAISSSYVLDRLRSKRQWALATLMTVSQVNTQVGSLIASQPVQAAVEAASRIQNIQTEMGVPASVLVLTSEKVPNPMLVGLRKPLLFLRTVTKPL